jgi:hypothetical protein
MTAAITSTLTVPRVYIQWFVFAGIAAYCTAGRNPFRQRRLKVEGDRSCLDPHCAPHLPIHEFQVKLNPSVEKKLLGYATLASATGVGVLALSQPSEAKIVYTPTHQTIASGTTLQLDLNGDGIDDFSFENRFDGPRRAPTFSTRTSAGLLAYPAAKTNQVLGTRGSVSVLAAGAAVGPKEKFSFNNNFMGGASASNQGPAKYGGMWAPPDGNEENRYVGLKFVINGEIHYGWARLSVEVRLPRNGGIKAQLNGYAYETEANKSIEAGKTSGADLASVGPATLGQLALGTVGLVARRREQEESEQQGIA